MPSVPKLRCQNLYCDRLLTIRETRGTFRRRTCSANHTFFTDGDAFVDEQAFYANDARFRALKKAGVLPGLSNGNTASPDVDLSSVTVDDDGDADLPALFTAHLGPQLRTGHYVQPSPDGGGRIYSMPGTRKLTFLPTKKRDESNP